MPPLASRSGPDRSGLGWRSTRPSSKPRIEGPHRPTSPPSGPRYDSRLCSQVCVPSLPCLHPAVLVSMSSLVDQSASRHLPDPSPLSTVWSRWLYPVSLWQSSAGVPQVSLLSSLTVTCPRFPPPRQSWLVGFHLLSSLVALSQWSVALNRRLAHAAPSWAAHDSLQRHRWEKSVNPVVRASLRPKPGCGDVRQDSSLPPLSSASHQHGYLVHPPRAS